jgi:hypothetical protein
MGASIHVLDANVMSSKINPFPRVSSTNVCPNFSFVDVSHASTFKFQENNMKKMVPYDLSFDQENMHMPLPNFGGSILDFDDNFENIMFDKELPKHKDKLDAIFAQPSFQIVNVNTSSSHVFNNLHNYLISITYIVDPKSIPRLPNIDRT